MNSQVQENSLPFSENFYVTAILATSNVATVNPRDTCKELRSPIPDDCKFTTYHSAFVGKIDENLLPGSRYFRGIQYKHSGIVENIETSLVSYGKITATKNKFNPTDAKIIKFLAYRSQHDLMMFDEDDDNHCDQVFLELEYSCCETERKFLEKLVDICADYAFEYKGIPESESTVRTFVHLVTEALSKYVTHRYYNDSIEFAYIQSCDAVFQESQKKIF